MVNQDEEVIEEDDMVEERYVAPVQFAGTSNTNTKYQIPNTNLLEYQIPIDDTNHLQMIGIVISKITVSTKVSMVPKPWAFSRF